MAEPLRGARLVERPALAQLDELHSIAGAPPSTVKTTDGEPTFIGRGAELDSIAKALRDARVVVLHGAPGLGKSRLAREYAHRHARDYPGGMFLVPFERPPPVELARLLRHTAHPAEPGEPVEDQCRRALRELGAAGRTLLIYDAIADERTLRDWPPYEGRDVHVIATSTSTGWARAWRRVDVRPLRADAERDLVTSILGPDASDRLVGRIVDKAGGVTVELCASAAAAYERIGLGDAVEDVAAEVGDDTRSSFESAWTLLSADAQLAMQIASCFVTARFPLSLVGDAWRRLGKSPDAMERAIHAVRTRQLATRLGDDLQVHQLIARFVRARGVLDEATRRSLYEGLLAIARAFHAHPGDLELRTAMLAHSPSAGSWAVLVANGSEWHAVGNALVELGQYAEALPWFERAVAAKEKGDVHGRVDPESLGVSLHAVGDCYASQGRFAEALPWFERAVAAAEKGDVHGRVDPESLGASLHQVGDCYARQGQYAEALPWFERAVAATEKGDVHGRVDPASLGASLHQVGDCYACQGQYAEALPWFGRAVAATEKGDVHGRVDPESLGRSLTYVGDCYASQGQYAEALPWLERAVAAKEKGDVHGRVDPASLGVSLHQVGGCYARQGQYAEALPWFERAVAATEKGDVHGRVDPESLGVSLHQVGVCHANQGQYAEALPWFERAVAAAEKGDVHGRVDPESLGASLHQVGDCYARQGQYAEALPWFERAVAATEKGDVRGRVDPESLGRSLHEMGNCYARQGQYAEALPWFERAVAAKEKGDVHGRVNPASLGRSLACVGDCYARQGQHAEAQPWFERAAAVQKSAAGE